MRNWPEGQTPATALRDGANASPPKSGVCRELSVKL
jgi:hypothetical protein